MIGFHTRFRKRPTLYGGVGAVEVLFNAEVEEDVDEGGVKTAVAAVGGDSKTCLPCSRTDGSGNRRGETSVALPDPQPACGQGKVIEWSP